MAVQQKKTVTSTRTALRGRSFSTCPILIIASVAICFPIIEARAEDYARLERAVPGQFVDDLAPVFDFDGDGCLPSSGISRSGQQNPGLKNTGSVTGECRSADFLDSSNLLHRYSCTSEGGVEFCGHFYALYFEKDQAAPYVDVFGHRHDWEYAAVWTRDGVITHGSVSAHGSLKTRSVDDLPYENGHMMVVYHKDGPFTHALRFAKDHYEIAENPYQRYVTPEIASWDLLQGDGVSNERMKQSLNAFDYGKAIIPLKDSNFVSNLNKYRPSSYPLFTGSAGGGLTSTPWFSEEGSASEMCPEGYAVKAIECRGDYCDDLRLWCARIPGLELSGSVQYTSFFSEESPSQYKSNYHAVVGMQCQGRYCDDISLIVREVGFSQGEWTPSFSEEGSGAGMCAGDSYVAGVHCSGRYCDNLSLFCKR